ncbi:MAG TPA: hypothetical protein VLB86_11720 [Gaiellaceae bacterium]|nr:hypothetical protein [Gaiellaceae bacterium]
MLRPLLTAALTLLLAACGGGERSPESVVRAWAESVRSGDAEAAARLFARGAEVVDGDRRIVLRTEADALRYTRRDACAGVIVRIDDRGRTIEAEFDLDAAGRRRCDGAYRSRALFRVADGRITFLHRLPADDRREVV